MILFFVMALAALAVCGAIYLRWKARVESEIAEGAALEWAELCERDPAIIDGYDEARFRTVYRRVQFPRFPGYLLACFTTFIAALPVVFGLLSALLWAGEKTGVIPPPVEVADRYFLTEGKVRFVKAAPPETALYYVQDLAGFYYFFGVLIAWVFIVAFYMRRYHSRRPGYLRDELIRNR